MALGSWIELDRCTERDVDLLAVGTLYVLMENGRARTHMVQK